MGLLSDEMDARVLTLEHRYYGESQPREDWSYDNLQWLTGEQALADLAHFIAEIVPDERVFIIGGSYPGALSSWFRAKYPHIALGALSSSGVVEAILDFQAFDEVIFEALGKSGEQCPQDVHKLMEWVDTEFKEGRGEAVKDPFGALGMPDTDFHFFLADIIVMEVQYGKRTKFCAELRQHTDDELTFLGWLNTLNVKYTDYDSRELVQTPMNEETMFRQWTYQFCTQFAYFQTPGSVTAMRSQNLTVSDWLGYCESVLQHRLSPKVDHWNLRFAGKHSLATKVIYTNGAEDPWRGASILPGESVADDVLTIDIKCADCSHCVDLGVPAEDDPAELTQARLQIVDTFKQWWAAEQAAQAAGIPPHQREAYTR